MNEIYKNLWDSYEVSEEEKNNRIYIEGEEPISQISLTDYTKRAVKYQTARKRLTDYNFKQMAKHKGIGVNEVASECSYYAPYDNNGNREWFITVDEPAKESGVVPQYARTWGNDGVPIGHTAAVFTVRGSGFYGESKAGILSSEITYGDNYHDGGFRSVIIL